MERKCAVLLTERQVRDLETYALSQELNTTNPKHVEFYSEMFLALNRARAETRVAEEYQE